MLASERCTRRNNIVKACLLLSFDVKGCDFWPALLLPLCSSEATTWKRLLHLTCRVPDFRRKRNQSRCRKSCRNGSLCYGSCRFAAVFKSYNLHVVQHQSSASSCRPRILCIVFSRTRRHQCSVEVNASFLIPKTLWEPTCFSELVSTEVLASSKQVRSISRKVMPNG